MSSSPNRTEAPRSLSSRNSRSASRMAGLAAGERRATRSAKRSSASSRRASPASRWKEGLPPSEEALDFIQDVSAARYVIADDADERFAIAVAAVREIVLHVDRGDPEPRGD